MRIDFFLVKYKETIVFYFSGNTIRVIKIILFGALQKQLISLVMRPQNGRHLNFEPAVVWLELVYTSHFKHRDFLFSEVCY